MSPDTSTDHSFYKTLFEDSHSIILIIDPLTGKILDANKAALDFYQYSKTDLLRMNISEVNALPDEEVKEELQNTALKKHNYFNFRHRLKNNEIVPVEVYSGPIEFQNRKVLYSIVHNISEKKQAQETLKKSESTIRAMINATNSLVYLFDLKGTIINLNTSGALLFNKSPGEMIGKKFKPFFNENDFSRIKVLVDTIAKTRNPMTYQRERDNKFYDINLYPIVNDSDQVDRICAFINDITDLKKTEKVFAAIETAGGICHEINQPLQVIMGNLELLKLSIKKDDPSLKLITTISSQIEKLGLITKKLTHITRYETKRYIKGTIFDIDKSTKIQ